MPTVPPGFARGANLGVFVVAAVAKGGRGWARPFVGDLEMGHLMGRTMKRAFSPWSGRLGPVPSPLGWAGMRARLWRFFFALGANWVAFVVHSRILGLWETPSSEARSGAPSFFADFRYSTRPKARTKTGLAFVVSHPSPKSGEG